MRSYITRVESNMHINCQLQAFNKNVIKEVAASLEEEAIIPIMLIDIFVKQTSLIEYMFLAFHIFCSINL